MTDDRKCESPKRGVTEQACGDACMSSARCKAFTFIPHHALHPCLHREGILSGFYDFSIVTAFAYIISKLPVLCM